MKLQKCFLHQSAKWGRMINMNVMVNLMIKYFCSWQKFGRLSGTKRCLSDIDICMANLENHHGGPQCIVAEQRREIWRGEAVIRCAICSETSSLLSVAPSASHLSSSNLCSNVLSLISLLSPSHQTEHTTTPLQHHKLPGIKQP